MLKETANGRLLPSYPLFVKDPYFSIWSPHDKLNDGDVTFWNGLPRQIYGVVRANEISYSFLGNLEHTVSLCQKSVALSAFSTEYAFDCEAFDLSVRFTSPLPPDDLLLSSCPVCYFEYELTPKTELHNVAIALFVGESICYDRVRMPICGGVTTLPQGKTAWMGVKKQMPLSQTADSDACNWGYWYLTAQKAFVCNHNVLSRFVNEGVLCNDIADTGDKFIAAADCFDVLVTTVSRKMTFAFYDTVAVNYFGEWRKGLWFDNGKNIFDAIAYSWDEYDEIMYKLNTFDNDLQIRAKAYGDDYLLLLYGALRQSMGAHKIVRDDAGQILFLSKECHSNGCICTVDVSYPSVPLYLLYNPEAVRGMLRPIFRFARMPVWSYDFAPHDVGTYPHCIGQTYGVNRDFIANDDTENILFNCKNVCTEPETDVPYTYPPFYLLPNRDGKLYKYERQMPVEECGNMLIMTAATLFADGDKTLAESNFDLLSNWVKYLERYGPQPGSQLCTDDFSGHLDKNVNLSVKAIVGIAAFAYICRALGKIKEANVWQKTAEDYAAKWKDMCGRGAHTPLTFDADDGTYSIKYNMAFDVIFGFNLFDSDLREREVDFYISNSNHYGVPLDNRADFTKSDWIAWASVLTDDMEKRKKMLVPIVNMLRETQERMPFADWYDTKSGQPQYYSMHNGTQIAFSNRSVQGGLFAPLLADSRK